MKCTIIQGSETHTVLFDTPQTLSALLTGQDISFPMPCGGNGTCGKCAVQAVGALSVPDEYERKKIASMPGYRLACRCTAFGDCTVTLPDASEEFRIVADSVFAEEELCPMGEGFGFAVDIGTTTVAVYLYDLSDGRCVERRTFMNPQSGFGADVISRIEKATAGEAKRLAAVIRTAVEDAFLDLAQKHGIAVRIAVITGNTAMLYLLMEESVKPLCAAPFAIHRYLGETISGLFPRLPELAVYLPRTNSAFVGSDITCSMLACGMHRERRTVLMVDIGTNGEMGLLHNEKLYVCATAAGPAFEGAGITFGCAAMQGAIDSVSVVGGVLHTTVIGGGEATGICGTGLIDAAAMLLSAGIIDETGTLDEENKSFAAYMTEYDDQPAVQLSEKVLLTQRDIRQLQLAKAAICAGIDTLLLTAGIKPEDVDEFYIAGGFGRYINTISAAEIGMFPQQLTAKVKAVGNAAGAGASMLLCSCQLKEAADRLAGESELVDLSTSPIFMERYIDRMHFGEGDE